MPSALWVVSGLAIVPSAGCCLASSASAEAWAKVGRVESMRTVTPDAAAPAISSPRSRGQRAWGVFGRRDVQVALVGTLSLRLATSLFAALIAFGLHDVYAHNTAYMNSHGAGLGINIVPGMVDGPAAYLTSPWLRWDANVYLLIARNGYGFAESTAFMPLYPLLVRLGSYLTGGHFVVSALLISTFATFIAFLLLYRLAQRLTGSAQIATYSVTVACILPIAFFFVAPYTESLFLALSLACILAALDRRWGQAAVYVALASLTRQQGVLLGLLAVPTIAHALRDGWRAHQESVLERAAELWRAVRGPIVVPAASAASYLTWLAVLHYVLLAPLPMETLTSASGWHQHFTVPGLGVLTDLLLIGTQPGNILMHHLSVPLDAVAAIVAAALLMVARRRLPAGLLLYLIACWCAAVVKVQVDGETNSAARYLLALLPLAIIPATWLARARSTLRLGYVGVCLLLGSLYLSEWVFWAWVN